MTGSERASKLYIEISNTSDPYRIDEVLKRQYVLIKTSAPKDYDSFGTITVAEYSEFELGAKPKLFRYVIQPVEHAEYFTGRVRSGLYSAEYSNDLSADAIWERLYTRMLTLE